MSPALGALFGVLLGWLVILGFFGGWLLFNATLGKRQKPVRLAPWSPPARVTHSFPLDRYSQRDVYAGISEEVLPLQFRTHQGGTEIWDLDGVQVFDAPVPPKSHECWDQTWGYINYFTLILRCPCGALSYDQAPYEGKNTRDSKTTDVPA